MLKCCFTGPRPSNFSFKYNEKHQDCLEIKKLLKQQIINTIQDGYEYFTSGMALGVDTWTAEIVLELKQIYPNIKLECAIPCLNQEKKWIKSSQTRYNRILKNADIIHYVSKEPYKPYLMFQRNIYMVLNSNRIIAVYSGATGGTKHTFDFALSKNKEIIQINPVNKKISYYNLPNQLEF